MQKTSERCRERTEKRVTTAKAPLVSRYLIDVGGLDIQRGSVIGFVMETMCRCHAPFTYPEDIDAGLRVAKLGSSSVRYAPGLFGAGEDEARADGHFIHIFVDRTTQRSVSMPEQLRAALASLMGLHPTTHD